MFTFFGKKIKQIEPKEEFLKNPFFYFGFLSFMLIGLLFFSSDSLAHLSYSADSQALFFNLFFKTNNATENNDPFFSKSKTFAIETPDLKFIQDNSVYGISTPRILTTQTLGSLFGESSKNKKDVIEISVQIGDTIGLLAEQYNISKKTVALANNISENATLAVGQTLTILPVSGLSHVVKSGDTISEIAMIYKSKTDDITAFNNLAGERDIFIGDILIIPGGVMPANPLFSTIATLADNFFIFATEGTITQGAHHFGRGVDVGNKCSAPIYAAATGTVQRALGNGKWNSGMGNYITILHSGGIVTYYGHLMSLFVKPGDKVHVGDKIGLIGTTGNSTGCHLHFEVIGAKNPLAKYPVGTMIKYK